MEFGSDFHRVDNYPKLVGEAWEKWRDGNFYANGRQTINTLIEHRGWKRIFMPKYFCYEVIDSIGKTGIEIIFYDDYPMADDNSLISDLVFQDGDVLFRMNYFGLRGFRDNSSIRIEVIEDHSHSLIGDWVDNSNADWCVASLRKTLPIAEGGVLWSPKDYPLPVKIQSTYENDELVKRRSLAMVLKSQFLNGTYSDKDYFRELYIETENKFDTLKMSAICDIDLDIIKEIDIRSWYKLKRDNWFLLSDALLDKVLFLSVENSDCYPFSFVVKGQDMKNSLVKNSIFPAILWSVPSDVDRDLLSIHCDARYSIGDIDIMIKIFDKCLK